MKATAKQTKTKKSTVTKSEVKTPGVIATIAQAIEKAGKKGISKDGDSKKIDQDLS